MGFNLSEIQDLLNSDSQSEILCALANKMQEYSNMIQSLIHIKDKLEKRMQNLQFLENNMHCLGQFFNIETKMLPPRKIAFCRYRSKCCHEIRIHRFYELDNMLKQQGIIADGFRAAIYHTQVEDSWTDNCDLEVCILVDKDQVETTANIRTLDAGLYVTGLYQGEYVRQCDLLKEWIIKHDYKIIGPPIEIYINSFMNTRFAKQFITEIQFPVKRD